MDYKHIQTTAALRNRNNVKAYKILGIEDGSLIFQLWPNSDKQDRIPISFLGECATGEFVDLQVLRTGGASYQIKLLGKTPPAFIPTDGRSVAL